MSNRFTNKSTLPKLLLLTGLALPFQATAISAQLDQRLDTIVSREREAQHLSALSVVLVDDASILAAAHTGRHSVAADAAPVDLGSVYRTGSVGKSITDLAVLIAVEQGLLDLDADIRTYLPDFAPAGLDEAPMTLRHLMMHQSGLVREPPIGHYYDDSSPSLLETVRSLNGTSLLWRPGSKTKYSNAGLAVVGRVLEVVHGKPFGDVLAQEIFAPLDMRQSRVGFDPALADSMVKGYMWFPGREDWEAPRFNLGMLPAGDVYTSMSDMAALMRSLLSEDKRLISRETFRFMWAPWPNRPQWQMEVGLGFSLLGNFDDRYAMARHGGAVYGFGTELALLPREKLGVYAVGSRDMSTGVAKSIAHWLLKAALAEREGRALPEYVPVPQPFTKLPQRLRELEDGAGGGELAPWVGRYGWDHNPLQVFAKDGQLQVLIEWFFIYPLTPVDEGRFRFPSWSMFGHEEIWFTRPDGERAASAVIGHGPTGVTFNRLE